MADLNDGGRENVRGLLVQLQNGQRKLRRRIKVIKKTVEEEKVRESRRKRPPSVLSLNQSPLKPVLRKVNALPSKRARLDQLTPERSVSIVRSSKNGAFKRRISSTPKDAASSVPWPHLSTETDTIVGPLSLDDDSGPKLSQTAVEMRTGRRSAGTSVIFHPSQHQSQRSSSPRRAERFTQSLNSSRYGALNKRFAETRLAGRTPRKLVYKSMQNSHAWRQVLYSQLEQQHKTKPC